MRVSATILFAVLLLSTVASAEDTANTAELEGTAKSLAGQLGMQLKTRLTSAIEDGGPAKAVSVCNVAAPEIAESLSTDGWKVGRTSFKLRNPDNKPDEWERSTLLAFEQQLAAGKPVAELQASIVESDQKITRYRFMKAIPIDTVCMTCHGKSIPQDVQSILAQKYPQDTAIGYQLGELRGAFTITKVLQKRE